VICLINGNVSVWTSVRHWQSHIPYAAKLVFSQGTNEAPIRCLTGGSGRGHDVALCISITHYMGTAVHINANDHSGECYSALFIRHDRAMSHFTRQYYCYKACIRGTPRGIDMPSQNDPPDSLSFQAPLSRSLSMTVPPISSVAHSQRKYLLLLT
jgi:hypothetical protein